MSQKPDVLLCKDRKAVAGKGVARADFLVVAQFDFWWSGAAREIPFGFAQGRLSLRLKSGSVRDDAVRRLWVQTEPLLVSLILRTKRTTTA